MGVHKLSSSVSALLLGPSSYTSCGPFLPAFPFYPSSWKFSSRSSTLPLWLHYLLPESIVPVSSRRLTLKQSLPPAVTTVALSQILFRASPQVPHSSKECCIHNSMDVCFTSGSASPLHIAATYGAEALLPTPPAPKSFIEWPVWQWWFHSENPLFSKELSHFALLIIAFWSALSAFLSWVTVFCLRHAPNACRGCRQLVPVLEGFI